MIDFRDGELYDLLPPWLSTTETACISYAIKMVMGKLLYTADLTRTQAMVDEMPDDVLDMLAVDLRALYYSQDLDIEIKRQIIKATIRWHVTAGTAACVEEMVDVLFGNGKAVPWYEFEEEPRDPFTFDIETSAFSAPDILERFGHILARVKSLRDHLRRIHIIREMHQRMYVGTGATAKPSPIIDNCMDGREADATGALQVGAGAAATPKPVIDNCMDGREADAESPLSVGTAATAKPCPIIDNCPGDREAEAAGVSQIGAGATATPRPVIDNCPGDREANAESPLSVGVAAVSEPQSIIDNDRPPCDWELPAPLSVGAGVTISPQSVIENDVLPRTLDLAADVCLGAAVISVASAVVDADNPPRFWDMFTYVPSIGIGVVAAPAFVASNGYGSRSARGQTAEYMAAAVLATVAATVGANYAPHRAATASSPLYCADSITTRPIVTIG